jgi:hypothetical protein
LVTPTRMCFRESRSFDQPLGAFDTEKMNPTNSGQRYRRNFR